MSADPPAPSGSSGRLPLGDRPDDGRPAGEGPRFADRKDPDAMRTIGEVAAAIGIRQHVLRYWEEQFPMLRPVKRSGGRRYYRPADVQLLMRIDRLVNREGYTLRGARMAIEAGAPADEPVAGAAAPPAGVSSGVSSGAPVAAVSGVDPAAFVTALRAMRERLAAALDAA